ncbi:hypothetical protein M378DRAFT_12705 [Amanita muscaria Koide BX008]|uniref:Uncharacterized protein n=1 Tax=Amanita muscaria (strain Koide BX008) TaxID=946122 RepID=A0A0C2SHL4_AMAMK|nr:hypothetical protein M378DRAFT_12705 [Amanita muscaria Koide BX008]
MTLAQVSMKKALTVVECAQVELPRISAVAKKLCHFGKWSEQSEWSALESGRTTYLRSVKMLAEWFNRFQSKPPALKAPLKALRLL